MKKLLSFLLVAAFLISQQPLQAVFAISDYLDPQYGFDDRLENWKNNLYNLRNSIPNNSYYGPGSLPMRPEVKALADDYRNQINDAVTCTRAVKKDADLKGCVDTYERKLNTTSGSYYRKVDRYTRLDGVNVDLTTIDQNETQLQDYKNTYKLDISKAEQLLQAWKDAIPQLKSVAEDTANNDEFAVMDAFSKLDVIKNDFYLEQANLQNLQQIKGFEDNCGQNLTSRINDVTTTIGADKLTAQNKSDLAALPAKCMSIVNEIKSLTPQELQTKGVYSYSDRFSREIDSVINNIYNGGSGSGGTSCPPYGNCIPSYPPYPPNFPPVPQPLQVVPQPYIEPAATPAPVNADDLKKQLNDLRDQLKNATDRSQKQAIRKQMREVQKQIRALKIQ